MRNFAFFLLGLTMITLSVDAKETCQKCQRIREENKKKVNPYIYYEDYLKHEGAGKAEEQPQQAYDIEEQE